MDWLKGIAPIIKQGHLLFARLCLRHEKPKDRDREQSHRCNAQKYGGATETRRYETEEGSAQRSADSGPRSNDALGQVEATGAAGDIGDDQRRQHAQYRSADAIEQLKTNNQRSEGTR